jgi:hypothetical protein
VLLDVPGGTYWQTWMEFVKRELQDNNYISPQDSELYVITDDVHVALEEVVAFYRNYHSLRFVEGDLVLRLQTAPSESKVATLNAEFADVLTSGEIAPVATSKAEIADRDVPDLARLGLRFDRHSYARLHGLIRRLNEPE